MTVLPPPQRAPRRPQDAWPKVVSSKSGSVTDTLLLSQVDSTKSTLHAYDLPANAKLLSLETSDVDFGHFIHSKPTTPRRLATPSSGSP